MTTKDLMNIRATKDRRKVFRNYGTPAETVLWTLLKNRQVEGLKFRRQHGVGSYIIDFYCPELKLAVELDGAVHDNPNAEEYDEARTNYLLRVAGITVLRFENKEVFCNQELIISSILEFKRSKCLPPRRPAVAAPPSQGGEFPRYFLLLLLTLYLSLFSLSAQNVSVAFWNVENLFDTIPSPFYDDAEWTPRGANKWNSERYRTKIENLARVLDELNADVVGLAEVENEGVVRDLVQALKTDYNYIHRTSGDSRGIDLALLYKGDKFFPDADSSDPAKSAARLIPSATGREFLHVGGELAGERVDMIICHMASNLNSASYRRRNMSALRVALEKLLAEDPAANIIVMGDMNAVPSEKLIRKTIGSVRSPWDFMYAPHALRHDARQGSYYYRGRWYLYDWIMTSPAIARGTTLKIADAGIYAKEYMTEATSPSASRDIMVSTPRRPRRTFYGGDYSGGFSDHFPVWMAIVK